MKLVIAQMKHETNTYSPVPTPLARFAVGGGAPPEGDAARAAYAGTGSAIAAFIELADGGRGDEQLADELRAWCKHRMRRYEYPHVVRFVDDLPRTVNGKVQRFRLRELAGV